MKTIKLIIAAVLVMAGMSVMGQWTDGGIYQTTSDAISIGTSTAPASGVMLDVYNNSGVVGQYLRSPFDGASNRAIGYYRIENTTSKDLFNIVLRYNNGAHEMLQSAYDASTTTWREFIYFNYSTKKYEIRGGVYDTEYKTNGDVLFNNTGSVCIGTGQSVPSGAKLAVNGKILATEIEVQLETAWPDYVFKGEYKLTPLSEVEKFIQKNGHLPNVPSASEISTNGVNLGQMDAILLQKIEELTLHMIELEKKNELLKLQIIDLQK